jgi:hypothetical protein
MVSSRQNDSEAWWKQGIAFQRLSGMPTATTKKRAKQDKKEGKAPSTQAGEFVREEMDKFKHGRGNAQSPKQAIAIGLSEARREGVALPARKKPSTRKKAASSRKKRS